MKLSTLKTCLKYLRAVAERYTPLRSQSDSLKDIYNYLPISESIATSGQPTEEQFHLIKAAGFNYVINLAPTGLIENSLEDQAVFLNNLSLKYSHIPVDFQNPTEQDFQDFIRCMNDSEGMKVWVHCAANARVSAFIYRYRRAVLNEDLERAQADLFKIWEPFGVWKKFIERPGVSDVLEIPFHLDDDGGCSSAI